MGKRSSFRRMKNDAYDTPVEAVLPLISHLPDRFTFDEPTLFFTQPEAAE